MPASLALTANPDSATVAAEGTVVIDPLANDSDLGVTGVFFDASHQQYFGLSLDYTQPVDANGVQHGEVDIELGPNGYPVFVYTADDPTLDSGTHTLTFTYTLEDEATGGAPSTDPNATTTVTITVTGNAVAGETLCGGNHPQTICGTEGNDNLCGGNQDDTLVGNGGADTLAGENGKDSLVGGAGLDSLSGGNGEDTLNGGPGDDTLSGGNGHDLFIFDFHFGHDVITDFDKDSIQVSVADWSSFQDLHDHAQQVGSSVVITSDDGQDSLTLLHTTLKSLNSSEFLFT